MEFNNDELMYEYFRGVLYSFFEKGLLSFDEWYQSILKLRASFNKIIVL
jgi:hypothetical protein